MSNENNRCGMFNKKKKSTSVTIPAKKNTAKPATKVKTPKAKPVKANAKVQQTQQAPPYQNTDFKFVTKVDQVGIQIFTNFHGNLIHKFLLPNTDYALWVGLNPQQKYQYTQVRVHPNAFWHDMQLVHAVILTIVNVLDTLFAEAYRIQVQQQRRM